MIQRIIVGFVIIILLAFLFWSSLSLQSIFYETVVSIEEYASENEFLVAAVFIGLSAPLPFQQRAFRAGGCYHLGQRSHDWAFASGLDFRSYWRILRRFLRRTSVHERAFIFGENKILSRAPVRENKILTGASFSGGHAGGNSWLRLRHSPV